MSAVTVALGLLLQALPAMCQQVDPKIWGNSASTDAIARSGNTIYIGGSFTSVGPNTGGGVPIDRLTGEPLAPFPRVAGVVKAVVGDGNGGWYIGGAFVAVGTSRRSNLAHIFPGGGVATWAPEPDGEVLGLALDGRSLYVGGSFSQIGGKERRNLAAIDVIGGEATEWRADANAAVRALLLHRGRLYVGGDFDSLDHVARMGIAEVDPLNGLTSEWNPTNGLPNGTRIVHALAARGDTIIIGGYRPRLAAIDAKTGLVADWTPSVTGPDDIIFGSPYVTGLTTRGNSVYVAGHFTGVGGQDRSGLAEVSLVTGTPTSWDPRVPGAATIALGESTLYVGGWFLSVGEQKRYSLAEVDLETGLSTSWNPHADRSTMALAVQGNAVYAGGAFNGMGSQWVGRRGLAAINVSTGAVKDWNPGIEGLFVGALCVTHGRVYVGGYFNFIGGQVRYCLASLDTLTGEVSDWNPVANSAVVSLVPVGDTLYVGGYFTMMGDTPRNGLASFDLNTGALTDWNPDAGLRGNASGLAVSDGIVYVGGYFSTLGGMPRHGVGAVDAVTGAVTDWDPQADHWVNTVVVKDSTVYVGGRFGVIGGKQRSNLAALDRTRGEAREWVANTNKDVNVLALRGDTLFAGGLFFEIAGETRGALAALDASTGALLPWDPDLSSREWGAGLTLLHPSLWSATMSQDMLYVGGWFGRTGMVPTSNFAAISFAPPAPPIPPRYSLVLAPLRPNPARSEATIRFVVPDAGPVRLSIFDVQGRRLASVLNGEPRPAGLNEVRLRVDSWREGFYFCRLEAAGTTVARKFVVLK